MTPVVPTTEFTLDGDGTALVGHAGAVLLRKTTDQAGLTRQLSGTLR